ncbi:MAG: hypothetical protein Q9211_001907 [Gyalolechia sp. 1 TL-2023]
MFVGDGTWDTTRNTFLLPNLVGFNFATTRYNGMGNRFREFNGYHNLILAHGIMAALTFLLFVPAAIMSMRFKRHRPNALHHWLGRTIALLGIAQVALGLTLYGSPKALFVLYALAVFILVLAYFILTYRDDRHGGSDYDDRYSYSYGSGSAVHGRRRPSGGFSNLVKAGAAGAGIAALASHFRNRSRSRDRGEPEVVGSRSHSIDDTVDEKYSQYGRDRGREGGWKDRLLKIGAVAGGAVLVKKFFGGRKDRDRDSDVGDYGPPLGGATAINPDPVERIEEGRPLPSNQHPLNHPLNHRRSTSSMSYDSYVSASQEGRNHGLRNAVAGLGALGLARNIFKGRRERKEQKRADAMREQERQHRANNRRLTGDGFPRRGGRRHSLTSTSMSDSTDGRPHHDPGLPPPLPAGTFPIGSGAAGAALANHEQGRIRPGPPPPSNLPPPNLPPPPANNPPPRTNPVAQPVLMPPIPPDPQGGLFHQESSASSTDGRYHRRRRSGRGNAPAATTGLAAGEGSSRRDRRPFGGVGEGSPGSPPVSIKVKMHNDGRNVTLRRLPEEEAAAERAARRTSKERHGRHRRDSASSLSGAGSGGERWRRTEALERQQAEQMRVESERLAAARTQAQNRQAPVPIPPPPPIPGSSTGHPPPTGSVSSPGNYDTEASAVNDRRRRRRAERQQNKPARENAGRNPFEFT